MSDVVERIGEFVCSGLQFVAGQHLCVDTASVMGFGWAGGSLFAAAIIWMTVAVARP